ncbi:MAG: DUF1707 domain-containing protein [Gemmatimonadota bacterium]
MTELPIRPISTTERQRAVDRLCAHFAADHLETDELERRLDLALAAQSRNELVALEQDLPALQAGAEAEAEQAMSETIVAVPVQGAVVDSSRPAPERDFLLSIMGGTERAGNWTPAKRIKVFAMMGGSTLDFREATFATREITVTLLSIMGGAEIIVPPGVHVESNGIAIMGGFGTVLHSQPTSPNAPVIRINGFVLMGGVEIKERFVGETEREAKRRIRAEKKAAKQASLPPGKKP